MFISGILKEGKSAGMEMGKEGIGEAETLTERAPMARKVRIALENMMIENVVVR